MKKHILAMGMAVVLTGILAGCGNSGNNASTAATANEPVADAVETDGSAENNNDTDTNKVYRIAIDTTFAPFEFENDNGEMVGIDLDLLAAIAADQGFEYELQIVGFSAAVTALEAGECDGVIAGMSITPEREEKYDFSDAYFDSGVGMGVLAGSDIKSYEDLNSKQVAAKIGTEGCAFAESIADTYGFTVIQFEDSANMYQDVLAGNSVACFEDYPVLGYEITRGLDLSLPLEMEHGSSYGFATLKGANPELVQMFNAGLANLKASGAYDTIIDTYITK